MTNALALTAPVDTLAMEFTRDFDAPVAALYRAHADPVLVKQWLGPHGLEMEITEWNFCNHGGYRYTHSNEHGTFGFNGTFHTVRSNEFILQTFEFEGAPDMANIEYLWFEDLGASRSRLRGRSICPTVEARDALLSSGMEGGMTEGYQKLDDLLRNLPA
ncbi:SRPBCC family protein [Mycolicibacterium vanbaalenii]|uniref:Activator of Hsp90 ATPase 1 family protein n=1 Tax=Mycolicibacterium vanbaalenii (strain DSM 7251 / JCM 13017 / BCRC 16820 / KCTC 9966 / NRRL B-24157 / PYR-1) TaxID=350058 RepID=A1T8E5_MYCVP|nr:SRPBCC family protein [Mycolicibacterium vanbaalenii]ABM13445.1 Activator of Hsp90 ATPase 1 family protein [Mycolicibacterium vanbaalenii PYR-1]MCV7126881.1 SRPBCC family protein [Mycolicibacterium vanbaalenii PYR-1]